MVSHGLRRRGRIGIWPLWVQPRYWWSPGCHLAASANNISANSHVTPLLEEPNRSENMVSAWYNTVPSCRPFSSCLSRIRYGSKYLLLKLSNLLLRCKINKNIFHYRFVVSEDVYFYLTNLPNIIKFSEQNEHLETFLWTEQCCGSGSGQIHIFFLDPHPDQHPGHADPDRYQFLNVWWQAATLFFLFFHIKYTIFTLNIQYLH